MDAEATCGLLVDLGILEHRVDPLAVAALQHPARLRAGEVEPHADDAVGAFALRRRDAKRLTGLGQRDQHQACVDELAHAAGDEREERFQVELGYERVRDLVQRLELTEPAGRRLVEPRVLDRDRRLRGEELGQLLVLGREVVACLLLGEIEVPVRHSPQEDRDAQERLHRRVVPREADRARVLGEVVQAQRPRLAYENAQDAAPSRRVSDGSSGLLVHAGGEEALEGVAGRVDDAERGVPRAGQLGRGLDDPLQEHVERELRAEPDPGVDEEPQAVELAGGRIHVPILTSEDCQRGLDG